MSEQEMTLQEFLNSRAEIPSTHLIKQEYAGLRERIAELGGALGEMTTRRNLAENEVRQLQAENERLRMAIRGLLSWCEEIAGDNINEKDAAHEILTVQQAIDAAMGVE